MCCSSTHQYRHNGAERCTAQHGTACFAGHGNSNMTVQHSTRSTHTKAQRGMTKYRAMYGERTHYAAMHAAHLSAELWCQLQEAIPFPSVQAYLGSQGAFPQASPRAYQPCPQTGWGADLVGLADPPYPSWPASWLVASSAGYMIHVTHAPSGVHSMCCLLTPRLVESKQKTA